MHALPHRRGARGGTDRPHPFTGHGARPTRSRRCPRCTTPPRPGAAARGRRAAGRPVRDDEASARSARWAVSRPIRCLICAAALARGFPQVILGCVLAGGLSSRFGSDKALAGWTAAACWPARSGRCPAGASMSWSSDAREAPAPTLPDWPARGHGSAGGHRRRAASGARRRLRRGAHLRGRFCGLCRKTCPWLLAPAPAYLSPASPWSGCGR
jgi:hypothetical protein